MHMQGDPRTMQNDPHYEDVVSEVIAFLRARADAAAKAGVKEIWVDPGIGFGKTLGAQSGAVERRRRASPRKSAVPL